MMQDIKIYFARRAKDKAYKNMREHTTLQTILAYSMANKKWYDLKYPDTIQLAW
jgi:hypothetical protein